MSPQLSKTISFYWDLLTQNKLDPNNKDLHNIVEELFLALNRGNVRVIEKEGNKWKTNSWIKQGILLYFKIKHNSIINNSEEKNVVWFDKISLLTQGWTEKDFIKKQIRMVPGSYIRNGVTISKNCVFMPCFVNTGAYIGESTMIDTWASVGSCAQVGKNCHISSGVNIGGVLEPLNANPVIIENNCFIGSNSDIVEGVIIRENSVISTGVHISSSTKIINRETGEVTYGEVPENSVVISGTIESEKYNNCKIAAAIIVKKIDNKTKDKTKINDILRSLN